jgi:hypothetical protein
MRKPTALEVLDQSLPDIQTKIVHHVEARIAEGAVVTSVVDSVVIQDHRKKALAHA